MLQQVKWAKIEICTWIIGGVCTPPQNYCRGPDPRDPPSCGGAPVDGRAPWQSERTLYRLEWALGRLQRALWWSERALCRPWTILSAWESHHLSWGLLYLHESLLSALPKWALSRPEPWGPRRTKGSYSGLRGAMPAREGPHCLEREPVSLKRHSQSNWVFWLFDRAVGWTERATWWSHRVLCWSKRALCRPEGTLGQLNRSSDGLRGP